MHWVRVVPRGVDQTMKKHALDAYPRDWLKTNHELDLGARKRRMTSRLGKSAHLDMGTHPLESRLESLSGKNNRKVTSTHW
jgi:hypothetical protein